VIASIGWARSASACVLRGLALPPLLGGRSFTIGPFYAKPELLIGFAAAVACTIALRFMLQATYLTFCRPSL
jgi:hypothetical protein